MTDKERIAALEKELQIKSEGLRILTGQYGKVVSDLEKGGTLVPPKHAAVVFRPGGKYSLLMPKMGDKAKVPDHVLMAAATMAFLGNPETMIPGLSVEQIVKAFTKGIKDG